MNKVMNRFSSFFLYNPPHKGTEYINTRQQLFINLPVMHGICTVLPALLFISLGGEGTHGSRNYLILRGGGRRDTRGTKRLCA